MILIGALFALCLLLVLLPGSGKPAARAQIVSDGNLVAVLDLNTPQEFTVSTERGTNTVTVRDGKIAVTHADCPDQYCVSSAAGRVFATVARKSYVCPTAL